MNRTNIVRRRLTGRLLFGFVLISGLAMLAACGSSNRAASSPPASAPPTASASPAVVASPLASPAARLPLTISASGLSVTLTSVTESKVGTRFDLSVQLPASAAVTTDFAPLIIRPNDIRLATADDTATSPQMSVKSRAPGGPAPFSVTFLAVANPAQPLTLTLAHIWVSVLVPGTPPTTEKFPGPWVFTVTPQQLANQPLPTPDHLGIYDHLTAKQAEQLVGFPLIAPTLPPIFDLSQSEITAGTYAVTGSARANWVIMRYPSQAQGQHTLTITETSNQSMLVALQNGQLRRVSDTGTPTSVPLTSGTTTIVTISGTPVTKIEATPSVSGTQTLIYQWGNQGVWYQVETIPGSPLTESVLEQIVASMIGQGK